VLAEVLLFGADLEFLSGDGRTPLMDTVASIEADRFETLRLLLELNANTKQIFEYPCHIMRRDIVRVEAIIVEHSEKSVRFFFVLLILRELKKLNLVC
jgi:hypothetical protein